MRDRRRWDRKGQGTLEYLLIIAVVIAAVAVAAGTVIKPAVTGAMDNTKTAIDNAAVKLAIGLGQ